MKKKIFLVLLVLIIIAGVSIIYLNKVILPTRIKSLIIASLEQATQKKVSLKTLEFNIFKGLVLRKLTFSDDTKTLVSISEASGTFLILPILRKKIIIPTLSFGSAVIFLERRRDNTFNLKELFFPPESRESRMKFSIFVYKVSIKNGRVDFQDDTLSPVFTKSIDNLNLILHLSLPASIKFKVDCQVQANPPMLIQADGQFRITDRQLSSQVGIKNFSPSEFLVYYKNLGFSLPESKIDCLINLNLKNDMLNADLVSDNILGMPVKAKLNLADFKNPLLNINVTSSLDFNRLQKILQDEFKFNFPANIQGRGNLTLNLENRFPSVAPPKIDGSLNILDASLKPNRFNSPFEDINGRLEFVQNQIKWSDLSFKYLDILYKTSGRLVDFRAPVVQLSLTSPELFLESGFVFKDNLLRLSQCKARFINSEFLVRGTLDTANPPRLNVDMEGNLNIDLKDIKVLLKKSQRQWEIVNPDGIMQAQFSINGNINEIKSCVMQVALSSPSISAYGLKSKEFLLNYNQQDGLADIAFMRLSLYDGTIEASAKMNLNSANLPYWISANIQGLKIEKLKLDTPLKEKDIAGTLQAEVKVNGFSNDLSKLSGGGKVFITDGKLWQLNLFKGLGELLFAKDFASIVFSEGYCGFLIQDKYIFSDNLKLKSNLVNLSGSCKIGLDSSIDASVDIEVLDELAPLTGTLKDLTTAIIGQAGRFGVIKISGTLSEPKYKFKPAVADIIKGLKDIIWGKE